MDGISAGVNQWTGTAYAVMGFSDWNRLIEYLWFRQVALAAAWRFLPSHWRRPHSSIRPCVVRFIPFLLSFLSRQPLPFHPTTSQSRRNSILETLQSLQYFDLFPMNSVATGAGGPAIVRPPPRSQRRHRRPISKRGSTIPRESTSIAPCSSPSPCRYRIVTGRSLASSFMAACPCREMPASNGQPSAIGRRLRPNWRNSCKSASIPSHASVWRGLSHVAPERQSPPTAARFQPPPPNPLRISPRAMKQKKEEFRSNPTQQSQKWNKQKMVRDCSGELNWQRPSLDAFRAPMEGM